MSATPPDDDSRLRDIANRLAALREVENSWNAEQYVVELGDQGERYTTRYLVSADAGDLPEPSIIAAEIDSPEIAHFIAHAPRDIEYLLARLDEPGSDHERRGDAPSYSEPPVGG